MKEIHVIDLIPAYALNCLEEEEAAGVSAHLASCAACHAEFQAYQEVAAHLARSIPQINPTARVKSELMERVRTSSRRERSAQPRASWWDQRARQALQSLANLRLSPAWNFVSLFLIVVLGVSNVLLWKQVQSLRRSQATSLRVVALQGSDFTPFARGMIVISMDGFHGTLVVDDLPDLDETHQYQLWLIQDGERTSGAVFSVRDGYGSVYVRSPEPLINYSAFGITIEPAGGSLGPTGEKVLGGEF